MTAIEHSYTMPLIFGVCRKQRQSCMSAVGGVTVPTTIVMLSFDWCSQWDGSTQVSANKTNKINQII